MGIPVQSECDMEKPDEHLLWALVNIGGDIGAPMLVPEAILRKWSEHLYYCGFRHVPELQQRWYTPPAGGDSFWSAPGGQWGEEPRDEGADAVDKILATMPTGVKADLLARLQAEDKGEQ